MAKTAVISQTGMARALGMSPRGSSLPDFLGTKAMQGSVGGDLAEKTLNPAVFQWVGGGGEQPPLTVNGFDVSLLIDVCHAIVNAESGGTLLKRHANIARQAHIILGASAKAGIKGFVYALAGYNPTIKEVVDAFKLHVSQEAKRYEKEFPNELYLQWHRLYQIPISGGRGKPWQFKYLTVRHIYWPLESSNGKIFELIKALKAKAGDRRAKLFQFLNELGTRAFRMHMGRVLEMAESSADRVEYEQKIADRFGDQPMLPGLEAIPTSSIVPRLLPSLLPPVPEAS